MICCKQHHRDLSLFIQTSKPAGIFSLKTQKNMLVFFFLIFYWVISKDFQKSLFRRHFLSVQFHLLRLQPCLVDLHTAYLKSDFIRDKKVLFFDWGNGANSKMAGVSWCFLSLHWIKVHLQITDSFWIEWHRTSSNMLLLILLSTKNYSFQALGIK